MKHYRILVIVLAMGLLAGCGGRAPAASTPAPASSSAAQAGKLAGQTGAEPAVAGGSAGEASEGDALQLTDEEAALKNLTSYKTTWSFEWTGQKEDGAEQTVKWLSVEAYTAEPRASYTRFETSDSTQPTQGGTTEFYQIGAKSYMVNEADGEAECTAFSSTESTPSQNMMGRSAFGSISDGKFVGVETVNGVQTRHYKYDEKATGVNFFAKLTGDVWVAEDGGYVVRDVANWEGSLFGLLGNGSASDVGKGSWTREVTEINQPFTITPPEGCENAAEGLPMMADATEQTSFGAMTTYKSGSKLADVVTFYQAEMAKLGWTAGENPQISDAFATLAFKKDDKMASVIITAEDETVNVMIQVE